MNYKYLFSDMDGTLIHSSKKVSPENLSAIHAFQAKGGYFTVATGRSPEITLPFLKDVHLNLPAILFNGAAIYDFNTKEFLYQKELPAKIIHRILTDAMSIDPGICIQAFKDHQLVLLNQDCQMDPFILSENQPHKFAAYTPGTTYTKLLFYGEPESLQLMANHFSSYALHNFTFTFSAPFYLELLPSGVSKCTSLRWLCDYLHIESHQVAAIGDFDNDADMLSYAGIGAAPQNASLLARSSADFITPSNDEHGVAYFIKNYLL